MSLNISTRFRPMPELTTLIAFCAILCIMGLACQLFYHFCGNISLRRKAYPWLVCCGAAWFIAFIYYTSVSVQVLLFAVPLTLLMAYLSIKLTRFCSVCGKMVQQHMPAAHFCPHCGSFLESAPSESLEGQDTGDEGTGESLRGGTM